MAYTVYVQPKEHKNLNIKLDKAIFEKVESFRFRRRFHTRTEAIEFLLEHALKANPAREVQEEKRAG